MADAITPSADATAASNAATVTAKTNTATSATSDAKEQTPVRSVYVDPLLGARIRKNFGARVFWGSVVGCYRVGSGLFYKVSFDDGDVDIFPAEEVHEDVKQTRRHAAEDPTKRSTQGAMETASDSISPYMEEMRRQPAKKRKRVEEIESDGGDEDGPKNWSVRLWGARLYASIATTSKGITRVKEFVPTNTGEIGEMEASGKVKKGDVIWKINDTIVTGMPSAEFMNLIRGTPRPIQLWFMRPDAPVTSDPPSIESTTAGGSNAVAIGSSSPSEPIVAQSITTSSQSAAIMTSSPSGPIVKQPISTPSGPTEATAVTSAQTAAVTSSSEQNPARGDLTFTVPSRSSVHSTNFPFQQNVQLRHQHIETHAVMNSSSAAPPNVPHPVAHFVNRNGNYQTANHGYPSGYLAPHHAVPSSVLTNMQFNGTRQHYQGPVAHQFNNSFQFQQLPWGGVANSALNTQQTMIGQHRYSYQSNQNVRAPTNNNIIQMPLQPPQNEPPNSSRQGVTWSTQHNLFGGTYNLHASNANLQSSGVQMQAFANSAPTQSMNYGPTVNQMPTSGQHSHNISSTHPQIPATGQPSSQLQVNNHSPQARVFATEQRSTQPQPNHQSPRTEIQRNASAIRQSGSSPSQEFQERSTHKAVQSDSTSNVTANVPACPEPTRINLRTDHESSDGLDAHAEDSQMPEDTSLITLDDEDSGETSFLSLDKPSFVTSLPEIALERGHPVPTPQFRPRSMTGNYVIVRIERKRLQVTLGMVGSRVAVTSFVRDENGNVGEIEESGKVFVGDCVVAVNGAPIHQNTSPTEVARLVVALPRPFELYFQRASWDALHG